MKCTIACFINILKRPVNIYRPLLLSLHNYNSNHFKPSIPQHRGQVAFGLFQAHAAAFGVVFYLVFIQFACAEVA